MLARQGLDQLLRRAFNAQTRADRGGILRPETRGGRKIESEEISESHDRICLFNIQQRR